jgi:hypothetical protein
MYRRCFFLDNCPGFNYNYGSGEYITDATGKKRATDTRKLGSILMRTMLNEVDNFCDPSVTCSWSHKAHQQV